MGEPAADPSAQFGEFAKIIPLLATLERIQAELAREDDLVWVLPADVLPGVTEAYGLPVLRAEIGEPLLAHRIVRDDG